MTIFGPFRDNMREFVSKIYVIIHTVVTFIKVISISDENHSYFVKII